MEKELVYLYLPTGQLYIVVQHSEDQLEFVIPKNIKWAFSKKYLKFSFLSYSMPLGEL